jgi:predicted lysophospholipase L1 biosynthesis ABC-type transport system permease subunit
MLTTMTAAVAPVLAETTSSDGINPWFVGIGTLVLLVAVMVGLLMFGAGRDHS